MTQALQVDGALAQWMLDRVNAGDAPETLLAAMQAQGWAEEAAAQALERVLRDHLSAVSEARSLPLPVPVPAATGLNGPSLVRAGGREVRVLASMLLPRVVLFGGLLDDVECEALVELSRSRLHRSTTLNLDTGANETIAERTSEGVYFRRGEHPLLDTIDARIAELVGWPMENGEPLQVLRYGPGAEYKPHYDYFDPARPGTVATLRQGGQRVASVVMYLNTPEVGGATNFPDAHFEVAAVRGNAVFFSYDRAHPMTRSLHGGAPVVRGEKWVATKWLRERRYC